MLRSIAIKLLLLIPVLFIVSTATFSLVSLSPGDPAAEVVGGYATAQEYQRVRMEMGLDKPILQRYGDWLGNIVRGDLGRNLVPPVEPVSVTLQRAFPVSVQLAAMALAMALLTAIPLAMWSAYRPGWRFDRIVSTVTFGLISVPTFLAALLLLFIFAINLQWFPLGEWARPTQSGWFENMKHAFLPAFTLALPLMSVFTRVLRSDMISTLQEDFILAARAKGMPPAHIMLRHALRPSSLSLVTLAGVNLGQLIGGTVIVESVFGLPGVGHVMVNAALQNDLPVVQGAVLVIAVVYIFLNLAVDLLYSYLDPRIRRGRI